jgi:hypothetical protein
VKDKAIHGLKCETLMKALDMFITMEVPLGLYQTVVAGLFALLITVICGLEETYRRIQMKNGRGCT